MRAWRTENQFSWSVENTYLWLLQSCFPHELVWGYSQQGVWILKAIALGKQGERLWHIFSGRSHRIISTVFDCQSVTKSHSGSKKWTQTLPLNKKNAKTTFEQECVGPEILSLLSWRIRTATCPHVIFCLPIHALPKETLKTPRVCEFVSKLVRIAVP